MKQLKKQEWRKEIRVDLQNESDQNTGVTCDRTPIAFTPPKMSWVSGVVYMLHKMWVENPPFPV
jgi:hypothetical protein